MTSYCDVVDDVIVVPQFRSSIDVLPLSRSGAENRVPRLPPFALPPFRNTGYPGVSRVIRRGFHHLLFNDSNDSNDPRHRSSLVGENFIRRDPRVYDSKIEEGREIRKEARFRDGRDG